MKFSRCKSLIAATLAALLATGIGARAAAPETPRPLILPKQDVRVTYKASDARAGSATILVAIEAGGARMRMDMPGQEGALIFEPATRRQIVIMPLLKSYIEMPADQFVMPALAIPADARFTRIGTSRVAGNACTRWQVESHEAQGTMCLTDDGVLLAADGTRAGRQGTIEAVKLDRAHIAESEFMPPSGFRRLAAPAGMAVPAR